jgi:hypothetical protein
MVADVECPAASELLVTRMSGLPPVEPEALMSVTSAGRFGSSSTSRLPARPFVRLQRFLRRYSVTELDPALRRFQTMLQLTPDVAETASAKKNIAAIQQVLK